MNTTSTQSRTTPTPSWHVRYADHRRLRRATQARREAIRTEIAIRQMTLLR